MQFRVLGTLEPLAGSPDRPVTLRSPRLRRLLALLLVHGGAVVSVDRIADVLWGEDPPNDPANALHNLVFRLRSTLGAPADESGAGVALLTRAPGYLLRLPPGATDAGRFNELVAAANRSAINQPQRASTLLDEALALWHGRAYAEFADDDFARTEAARLEELRLAALETWADMALQIGHHVEAIGRLEALVADQPLRERPHHQLMVACYRAGRQVDALQVFRRYREHLDDELGLEPSSALQQLQAGILRQDPALGWTPADAVEEHPPVSGSQRGNLPTAPTGLVGRERELADLAVAVSRHRLVTLTGVGGVGKTRLGLQVAGDAAHDFDDGAWLVELAAVNRSDAIADAVSTLLGVQQRQGIGVTERLVEYLRPKRLLLVVDNCEHVAQAAAMLIDAIARGCPQVTILATSREPLGLDGEHIRPIAPLEVPPPTLADPAAATSVPAVRLLVERAAAAAPGFALEPGNLGDVIEICRRLDGLPLAIELAAPKLRAMSPAEIVPRLSDRFRFLRSGRHRREAPRTPSRSAAERHQTLRNIVDWSYELLAADQRRVFERLSVFAGTFTLAAAERVCAVAECGTLERADVAGLLADLVDRSMVVAQIPGTAGREAGPTRYTLLETLRAYGLERLAQRGEEDAARRAHGAYQVGLAEEAEPGLRGPDEPEWVAALAQATDDLRAAHIWAVSHDLDLAVRLSAAVFWYAEFRVVSEMFEWADRVIGAAEAGASSADPHPLLPVVYASAAVGARFRGDLAACAALAQRGAALGRGWHDPAVWCARNLLADVEMFEGRLENAERAFADLARDTRNGGGRWMEAVALFMRSLVRTYSGDTAGGVVYAREAQQVAGALGSPTMVAWASFSMAEALLDRDPDRASELLTDTIALARTARGRYQVGVALVSAASLQGRHGDPRQALGLFRDVIAHWHEAGGWTQLWLALRSVVSLLVRVGADEPAAVLYGALESSATAPPVFGADAERLAETALALKARLGPERLDHALRRGATLTDDQAVACAIDAIDGAVAATVTPAGSAALRP